MSGADPAATGAGDGPRAVLLTRAGCHLCGPARQVVADVAGELRQPWEEWDLDAHPALVERYRTLVPVLLVDGREVGHWRLDPAQVRRALRRPWWRRIGRRP